MISRETAAGLIAGALDGKVHLGPVWRTLPPESIATLASRWAEAMRNPGQDITELIFHDLQTDPILSPAWVQCDSGMREYLRIVIGEIVAATYQ